MLNVAIERGLGPDELRRVLAATLAVARAAGDHAPESLLELALDRLLELVPADRVSYFSIDPLTDEAVRLAWREREAPEPARFAPGQGTVGWVVTNRAALLVTDARRDPRFQPIRYPATRSVLTVPLEWEGRISGALCCTAFAADVFSALHLEIVQLFGEHLAAALALCAAGRLDATPGAPTHTLAEYAHEVRGPLHTALGYLSLVGDAADQRTAEAIVQARHACQQALELSDATLDDAAEQRQGLASIPLSRPTDLTEVLRGCINRAQLPARLRSVSLELGIGEGSCVVGGRQHALERLLDNLILNAVEHSPEGSLVSARVGAQGDRAVLVVEDQGPGIPEGDLEKIFAPFYRGNGTNGRRGRSGGLGLSLARRWAVQSGGRLWAENRGGGGARLVLQLPLHGTNGPLKRANGHAALGDE